MLDKQSDYLIVMTTKRFDTLCLPPSVLPFSLCLLQEKLSSFALSEAHRGSFILSYISSSFMTSFMLNK